MRPFDGGMCEIGFYFLIHCITRLSTSVLMQARSVYIGYKYRGVLGKILPNGVKYFGGGIISDANADPVL
jgi:hypothetical protein